MKNQFFFITALLISCAVADLKVVTKEFFDNNFNGLAVVGWTITGNY